MFIRETDAPVEGKIGIIEQEFIILVKEMNIKEVTRL
jgi:hypothetical protein